MHVFAVSEPTALIIVALIGCGQVWILEALRRQHKTSRRIEKEVKPNGGTSSHDKIMEEFDKLEQKQDLFHSQNRKALDQIDRRVAVLEQRRWIRGKR
jgi:hypothetical protein